MFPIFVAISAFGLAAVAAWFSISGIAQLFIGASVAATIMAAALELAKIVGVSYLYRNWTTIPKALKTYMTIGAVVLMLITSLGIYGFLSSAYASAAKDFNVKQAASVQADSRVQSISNQIQQREGRISQLQTIRSQQETRLNALVGKQGFITQQRVVRQAETDIRSAQKQLDSLTSIRDSLSLVNTTAKGELTSGTKMGTFNYVAQTIGVPLDNIVRWFILAIVFVFDPMALALVMAFNSLTKKKIKEETPPITMTKFPDSWVSAPFTASVTQVESTLVPSVEINEIKQEENPIQRWRSDGGVDLRNFNR